jgi:hypothetical protein
MDQFIQAYDMGRRQARLDFEKSAGAKDVADLLRALGSGISAGTGALGKGVKGLTGGAEFAGKGAKYLGTVADPRAALLLGTGLAVGGAVGPAAMHASEGLVPAAKAALPGALAALGGGLAMGANPGMMGGSMANRLSHELAMMSATPAGQVAAIASVVGLPAALIAYGKKKGREESSLF